MRRRRPEADSSTLCRADRAPGGGGGAAPDLEGETRTLYGKTWKGRQAQAQGALGPLLGVGCPLVAGQRNETQVDNHYRLMPLGAREIEFAKDAMQAGLERLHGAAHTLLKRVLAGGDGPKEAALAWLSAVLGASADRATKIYSSMPRSPERAQEYQACLAACAGDEYVVNLTATLLKFCGPFLRFADAPPPATLEKLDPSHYRRGRAAARVDYSSYTRLAGKIVAASSSAAASSSSGADAASESLFEELENDPPPAAPAASGSGGASLSFVGEAFFLTQYAFHVGFVPALRQWRTQMGMFRHTMTAAGGNSHEANVNLYRIEQSYIALLFPPSLLQGAILFMRLQAAWLDGLLKRPPAEARAALEAVPEWVVHDLCYFVDVVIMMYPRTSRCSRSRPSCSPSPACCAPAPPRSARAAAAG